MRVGLSIHTPYTASARLLAEGAAWCRAEQVPLSIHVAESPAEALFFREGHGPLLDLNRRFYPNFQWAAPGCSPVQYLERLGVLEARPLLFHGVQVDETDLSILARAGCAMVHCPRSNTRLQCGRMPLERYLEHGIVVALGTDSLASSPSLDLREELAAARALHGARVPEQALLASATTGGARALGISLF
jgi:aminodeoxyfutalosine deaminase